MTEKQPIPALIRFRSTLRDYCDSKRGMRAEIARLCHGDKWRARLTDVTDWISGKHTPKGEHVLAILQWLPPRVRAKVFKAGKDDMGATCPRCGDSITIENAGGYRWWCLPCVKKHFREL